MFRRAPLLLVLLAACGLDEFAWGGGKNCSLEWKMTLSGPKGADRLDPEITNVHSNEPGDISWTATYFRPGEDPLPRDMRIIDLTFAQPAFLLANPIDNAFEEIRVAGPCAYSIANEDGTDL